MLADDAIDTVIVSRRREHVVIGGVVSRRRRIFLGFRVCWVRFPRGTGPPQAENFAVLEPVYSDF